jgi:class 3 adenylate cyclase
MGSLKQRHGRGLTLEADYPSQGVNVARRITDLSDGGSLAVLIDRIVAGHTVQLIKSNWTGVFTNDAAQALDELRLELEYNAREACRYIDMEWMDEDSGTSDQ